MSASSTLSLSLMDSPASDKGAKALEFIEEVTKNADAIQKYLLEEILTQNAETEYLKSLNLGGATDRETFKSKIPMVTYEELKPFIQRIADGDRSPILSAQPISEFIASSGTSAGEPMLIPVVEGDWERRRLGFSLLRPVMNQYVKGLDQGKALHFRFAKGGFKTRGGLTAHSASSNFYKNMRSRNRTSRSKNVNTSPNEVIGSFDVFQSMYTQLLCGLYDRENVLRIGSPFPSSLILAITFLKQNWQQLTQDMRTGSLNPKVTDPAVRECMARIMRPDAELADCIAHECGMDNWERIITRLWPHTKYIDVIISGSMAQYVSNLDYYSGGLPIVSTRYAASECFIGINLNPMCKPSEVAYTIMPNMAYFEFLPIEPNSHELTHSALVDLVDVEIGKEYELVVTTRAGLYRYRVGDILRVTGFHNSVPQFQFVRRKNVLLSIDVDKTNESELQAAINNASLLLRELGTIVVEYTSYADTTTTPGHYVIYWELLAQESADPPSDEVLGQCCLAMEESLNLVYRVIRRRYKSIGPLEIRVVKKGTFEELMNYAISKGASIGQYKVPRCVSSMPILNLLDSRVVSKHFSPSLPRSSADDSTMLSKQSQEKIHA